MYLVTMRSSRDNVVLGFCVFQVELNCCEELRSLISGLPIVFAQLFVPHVHADLQTLAHRCEDVTCRRCVHSMLPRCAPLRCGLRDLQGLRQLGRAQIREQVRPAVSSASSVVPVLIRRVMAVVIGVVSSMQGPPRFSIIITP
jgi:hypothetical protein